MSLQTPSQLSPTNTIYFVQWKCHGLQPASDSMHCLHKYPYALYKYYQDLQLAAYNINYQIASFFFYKHHHDFPTSTSQWKYHVVFNHAVSDSMHCLSSTTYFIRYKHYDYSLQQLSDKILCPLTSCVAVLEPVSNSIH